MGTRAWIVFSVICVTVGLTVAIKSQQYDEKSTTDSFIENDQPQSASASTGYSSENENSSAPMFLGPLLSPVDRNLPNFSLASLDGTQYTADSLQGKPWIINFWATWCPPCVHELPSMNAAYGIVQPQGVGMLAINVAEGASTIRPFLKRVPIDFPVILGETSTMAQWSVRVLPTTIVVDAQGKVVYEAQGEREWDDHELLQQVIDLL